MAEEATEEQESREDTEASTLERLKDRVKDMTGMGSDDDSNAEDASASDTEAEGSESEEAESGSNETGEGASDEASDEGESEEYVGEHKIDEVDPDEETQDDDKARAQIRKLEKEGPPESLADWPTGKAMYLTFGGAEGEASYEEGQAAQLGPSSTRHHADGSVEVQGEMADDPEEYKAEQSVFEESEELGMDKGAKSEEGEEDEDSSGEGSAEEGSSEHGAQAESDHEAGSESAEDSSAQDETSEEQTAERG